MLISFKGTKKIKKMNENVVISETVNLTLKNYYYYCYFYYLTHELERLIRPLTKMTCQLVLTDLRLV